MSTPRATNGELLTMRGIQQVAELGLDCMELEFVKQVYLKKPDAEKVGKFAKDLGISLSAHRRRTPLISMPGKRKKIRISQSYFLRSAEIAYTCGAKSVVFHPAYYMGDSSEQA